MRLTRRQMGTLVILVVMVLLPLQTSASAQTPPDLPDTCGSVLECDLPGIGSVRCTADAPNPTFVQTTGLMDRVVATGSLSCNFSADVIEVETCLFYQAFPGLATDNLGCNANVRQNTSSVQARVGSDCLPGYYWTQAYGTGSLDLGIGTATDSDADTSRVVFINCLPKINQAP